jgi:hypothetical protein
VLVEISVFFSYLVEAFEVSLISHLRRLIKIITILLNAIKNISLGQSIFLGLFAPERPFICLYKSVLSFEGAIISNNPKFYGTSPSLRMGL